MAMRRQRAIAVRDQFPRPGDSRLRKRQLSAEPRKSESAKRRSGARKTVIPRRMRSRKWPRERAKCCDSAREEFKSTAISEPGKPGGEAIKRQTAMMPPSKPRRARTVDESLPHWRRREP